MIWFGHVAALAHPPPPKGRCEGGKSSNDGVDAVSLGRRRYAKVVTMSRVWLVEGLHSGRHLRCHKSDPQGYIECGGRG